MRILRRVALRLVPSSLAIGLVSLGGQCLAQEVETPPGSRGGFGSVFAPSGWIGLIVPVHERISLRPYGFYIGELDVPCVQFDVPIRATKSLTITPSYMYYEVPVSGLNELASVPGGFTDSYDEHQVRIDGTFRFDIRKFEISVRNMYVRRFRPTDEVNRYRGRISIAHPLAVKDHIWKPFASYEAYYDEGRHGGWNKDRVWVGVTLPLEKRVSFQPSYLWESSQGSKDISYLLFGVIVSTR